jgi:hypothetical protein
VKSTQLGNLGGGLHHSKAKVLNIEPQPMAGSLSFSVAPTQVSKAVPAVVMQPQVASVSFSSQPAQIMQTPMVMQPQVASLSYPVTAPDNLGGSMVAQSVVRPQGGAREYYAALTGNQVPMSSKAATTNVPSSQVTIASTPQQFQQVVPGQVQVAGVPQTMPAPSRTITAAPGFQGIASQMQQFGGSLTFAVTPAPAGARSAVTAPLQAALPAGMPGAPPVLNYPVPAYAPMPGALPPMPQVGGSLNFAVAPASMAPPIPVAQPGAFPAMPQVGGSLTFAVAPAPVMPHSVAQPATPSNARYPASGMPMPPGSAPQYPSVKMPTSGSFTTAPQVFVQMPTANSQR